MAVIVRFAPSPTGRLHVGNVRTALLNWLFARQAGGDFWLRLDDTDVQRSTEAFADGIRRDLEWLGLDWTREERQSARIERYVGGGGDAEAAAAASTPATRPRTSLTASASVSSRADCRRSTTAPGSSSATPSAPRSKPRAARRTGASASPTPRPALTPLPTIVSWNDLIRGDQTVDVGSLSDPVVIRADGTFLYTFTSVVDDADFGITHVIRGEDHVTNTGVQLQLFEALEHEPPAFGHHSLLIGADGQALSKRLGALSIESLRESGLEPMAVASYTALIGTSDAIEPQASLDELAHLFAFDKISTAPARFDPEELKALNAQAAAYDAVRSRRRAAGAARHRRRRRLLVGRARQSYGAGRRCRVVAHRQRADAARSSRTAS